MLVARFDGTILATNPAWTTLLGWDEADLVGTSFLDLIHPDDTEATQAEAGRLSDGLSTLRFENRRADHVLGRDEFDLLLLAVEFAANRVEDLGVFAREAGAEKSGLAWRSIGGHCGR